MCACIDRIKLCFIWHVTTLGYFLTTTLRLRSKTEVKRQMNIAFLETTTLENGLFLVGAMLITNEDGYPVEVAASDPIKLTFIEKIAFGASLKGKALVDKICLPILDEIQTKPDFLLIKQPQISALQLATKIPVILLKDSEEEANRFDLSNDYTGEIEFLACDEEKDVDQNLWEKFEESFIYEDILEPFSRIETLIQHMQVNGWDFEGQQD